MSRSTIQCLLAVAALLVTVQGIAAAGRTVLQSGGRSPAYSADFMAGYTAAVQKYQIQLQQQQQQEGAATAAVHTANSANDRKLLQTGGRAPSFSPDFIAAYTAAVQKYQLQLQQQQQQQQPSVSSASSEEISTDGRKLLQTGGRSPAYSADFVAAYTAAIKQYQALLQLQQQQQQQVSATSADIASIETDAGRKLLQTGGRAPSFSPDFMAAYTAAVQTYQAQVALQQQQQQQQQQQDAASPSNAIDGGRRLLQTGNRDPSFSPDFIAAYTAAVQKYQAQVALQQQQQQQQQQDAAPSNAIDGGRRLQQTGGRGPAYNEAFMAGYTAAVQQYQAVLLQQKQQQQQAAATAAAAQRRPARTSGRHL